MDLRNSGWSDLLLLLILRDTGFIIMISYDYSLSLSISLFPISLSNLLTRGVDGKFYLLDFSRTMPPVAPQTEKYYNGHLFYLFRREFVRANSKPLCSDAFSVFFVFYCVLFSGIPDIFLARVLFLRTEMQRNTT